MPHRGLAGAELSRPPQLRADGDARQSGDGPRTLIIIPGQSDTYLHLHTRVVDLLADSGLRTLSRLDGRRRGLAEFYAHEVIRIGTGATELICGTSFRAALPAQEPGSQRAQLPRGAGNIGVGSRGS
jgi:hypothetical protein